MHSLLLWSDAYGLGFCNSGIFGSYTHPVRNVVFDDRVCDSSVPIEEGLDECVINEIQVCTQLIII